MGTSTSAAAVAATAPTGTAAPFPFDSNRAHVSEKHAELKAMRQKALADMNQAQQEWSALNTLGARGSGLQPGQQGGIGVGTRGLQQVQQRQQRHLAKEEMMAEKSKREREQNAQALANTHAHSYAHPHAQPQADPNAYVPSRGSGSGGGNYISYGQAAISSTTSGRPKSAKSDISRGGRINVNTSRERGSSSKAKGGAKKKAGAQHAGMGSAVPMSPNSPGLETPTGWAGTPGQREPLYRFATQ